MSIGPLDSSSIYIVAVCFQLEPETFVARLQSLAVRCRRRFRGVVVNNNPTKSAPAHIGEIDIIKGTNMHLDFSGYFEGLERLVTLDSNASLSNVLFVNDSLFLKHASVTIFNLVIDLHPLLSEINVPAMSGKLDPYRSICLCNPWSGQTGYMATFCFLLNERAQPFFRHLLTDAQNDGVLSEAPLKDAEWGEGLDPTFREQIRAHLVYPGSPYLWQTAQAADPDLLHKKARCVYFEQRLSGAIGAQGALLPINSGARSRTRMVFGEAVARLARAMGIAG